LSGSSLTKYLIFWNVTPGQMIVPAWNSHQHKQAIESAATEIGGAKRLAAWIKDNERVFWSHIYTKLLPLQVTGQDGGALKMGGNAGRIRAGK
jgi:hypothetical protein